MNAAQHEAGRTTPKEDRTMPELAILLTLGVIGVLIFLFADADGGKRAVAPPPPEPISAEDRFNLRALVTLVRERRAPPVESTGLPFRTMKGERLLLVCHGMAYAKRTTKIEYEGRHSGASFRVAKGVTLRTGGSKGRRIERHSFDVTDFGTLGLTTKHVYWATEDPEEGRSFRVRLDKLVAIHAMEGGVHVMRDLASAKPEAFLGRSGRIRRVSGRDHKRRRRQLRRELRGRGRRGHAVRRRRRGAVRRWRTDRRPGTRLLRRGGGVSRRAAVLAAILCAAACADSPDDANLPDSPPAPPVVVVVFPDSAHVFDSLVAEARARLNRAVAAGPDCLGPVSRAAPGGFRSSALAPPSASDLAELRRQLARLDRIECARAPAPDEEGR